jgi:hypothetical protein
MTAAAAIIRISSTPGEVRRRPTSGEISVDLFIPRFYRPKVG